MTVSGSIRGAGFGPVLAAQRAYTERTGSAGKFGLMVPEAFVRGIRDLGYRGNGDAIAEFIDNSLQAFADRIDVVFGYEDGGSAKKPTRIAIIDNGHGMERDMIRMAVMWGGTHRENDRTGLGRYGYGLPCACVSLGRRFSVYSKATHGDLYKVALDLDDLTAGRYTIGNGEIVVPEAESAELPQFVEEAIAASHAKGWHHGTVILIDKLDRLEWQTTNGLRENLVRQFAVTYHKLRNEADIYVDWLYVDPVDPVFTTPGLALFDLDEDRARELHPIRVEVRDEDDNHFLGAMTLRYAWLPPSFGSVDKDRDAVGLNANPRFSILKDYHGIIFSRNGRLIDVQTRTPWTSFINNDRYIRVELEFSASLDELFGVTTSKQQVTVSPRIWDLLREAGVPKAIEQLRAKVRDAKLERRAKILSASDGVSKLSEKAMTESAQPSQLEFHDASTPYRMRLENRPGAPFFRVEAAEGSCVVFVNMSHRFYSDLYDGELSTPTLRAALEVLLFSMGDVILMEDMPEREHYSTQIEKWSLRLETALDILASHIRMLEEREPEHGTLDFHCG